MKLYYSPGACSLSPHIVLREAQLDCELICVPTKTHKLPDGSDFYAINPLGYVPVLELDNGNRLREGPAIVQYLADLAPEKHLAPPLGSWDRYRLMEWLTFIGTELHKGFSPLFNPATPADMRQMVLERLRGRLEWLNNELNRRSFLLGDTFSVADAYLFTVTGWSGFVGLDLSAFTHLLTWREQIAARPAVQLAMREEGLIP